MLLALPRLWKGTGRLWTTHSSVEFVTDVNDSETNTKTSTQPSNNLLSQYRKADFNDLHSLAGLALTETWRSSTLFYSWLSRVPCTPRKYSLEDQMWINPLLKIVPNKCCLISDSSLTATVTGCFRYEAMYLWGVFEGWYPQWEPIGLELWATDRVGSQEALRPMNTLFVLVSSWDLERSYLLIKLKLYSHLMHASVNRSKTSDHIYQKCRAQHLTLLRMLFTKFKNL